jgi:hypothetical protein
MAQLRNVPIPAVSGCGNRPVRALESGRTTGNYPNYLDTCLEDQEFIQSINQYEFRDSIFVFKPLRINSDAR